MGIFLRQLYDWSEKPCVLTVRITATGGEIRVTGVLRSYYSFASLHGWALVPPQQHGGWSAQRLTELDAIADAGQREVVLTGRGRLLRYSRDGAIVFELERDDAVLTPPPRVVRHGRYLYVGGRRRRAAESWMLQ
ncbi:MAG TPA: hypothetical protein VHT53_07400 [Candidatus Elarobacter sp.]|nr:hypothetical protein [Candidatus Elarobacter sp.]